MLRRYGDSVFIALNQLNALNAFSTVGKGKFRILLCYSRYYKSYGRLIQTLLSLLRKEPRMTIPKCSSKRVPWGLEWWIIHL